MNHPVWTDEPFRIPADVRDFASFRRWSQSAKFPERGRIDWLAGHVEVDMSPEELYTHNAVKVAIGAELHRLVVEPELGVAFIGRARVASPAVELSVEPDVVVVLWASLAAGRIRDLPSPENPERLTELEGAPDLVVEVASDGSMTKDRRRLPPLYAAAGVTELWLVDARDEVRFQVLALEEGHYREVPHDDEGWATSPLLGRRVRFTRRPGRPDRKGFRLEHDEASAG